MEKFTLLRAQNENTLAHFRRKPLFFKGNIFHRNSKILHHFGTLCARKCEYLAVSGCRTLSALRQRVPIVTCKNPLHSLEIVLLTVKSDMTV